MGNPPSFNLKLLSAYLVVHASYLLHHVLPSQSPSPWSLLGRWREYVCLYFLHVLCFPQLRLVSFFFCCLNNPCCIYKQNLRFINHRIFFQLQSYRRRLYTFHNTSCIPLKILLPSNYPSFREWSYHLHGKTGNPGWKIKWFAPLRLGTFRKYGLWFEAMPIFLLF